MKSVPPRRLQLDALRRQIADLDSGLSLTPACPAGLSGVGETAGTDTPPSPLDLAPGLHEVCPASYLDTPAALAFQLGLLAQRLREGRSARPIVWVRPAAGGRDQDFGRPYPLGLRQWGLPPDRLLLVETPDARDRLWALEEALNAGALVIGEIGRHGAYDLTASKRLHRAARSQQGLALLLRSHADIQPSATLTRWRISALQSPPRPWRGASGLPGLGEPRFRAVLERVRGGPPRQFELEWKHASFHVLEPAPLARRTAPRHGLGQHRLTG